MKTPKTKRNRTAPSRSVQRLVSLRLYLEANRGHMQTLIRDWKGGLSGTRYWKNGVKKLTTHIATLKTVERDMQANAALTAPAAKTKETL